jgi:hypothetical protein
VQGALGRPPRVGAPRRGRFDLRGVSVSRGEIAGCVRRSWLSPPHESHLSANRAEAMRRSYIRSMHWVCERCLRVQLGEFVAAKDIFVDHAYFAPRVRGGACRKYVDSALERLRMERSKARGRAGQPRRRPATALRDAGHPGPESRLADTPKCGAGLTHPILEVELR